MGEMHDYWAFHFVDDNRPKQRSVGSLDLSLKSEEDDPVELHIVVQGSKPCARNGYVLIGTAFYDNKGYDVRVYVSSPASELDVVILTEKLPLIPLAHFPKAEPHSIT